VQLAISEIYRLVGKELEMSPDHGPITVVLATDSLLIGDGLAALLAENDDVKVVGRARQHDELVQMVDELAPEAVVISIRTPIIATMAMIEVARRLRVDHPDLGIVVISDRGNGFAVELLRGGASGIAYLLDERLPTIESVLNALREVRAGQTVLDPSIVDALVTRREGVAIDDLSLRELDVLELIADGLSNRGIATTLKLSIKAVERHITAIFRKLELADQTLVDRRVTAALTYQHAQTSPLMLRHQGPPEGRDVFRPRT
jgi:DNA-binding NarL/FixJ family response regulator